MKTRVLIKEGEYRLTKAGVMDAGIDAEELFCYLTGWDKVMLFLKKEEEADKEIEDSYFRLVETRAQRIPLQHITGVQEFMGFEFKVSPDVLIPRQDTETLVTEAAGILREEQKTLRGKKSGGLLGRFRTGNAEVLDMCCGSGAVGISLAKVCENISVTATDLSPAALELAVENAGRLKADVKFFCGDMFNALSEGEQFLPGGRRGRLKGSKKRDFDMIVSNPPYIRTRSIAVLQEEVKKHEPLMALDGGEDGFDFYRIIIDKAAHWLKPEGWLLMEIGFDQGEDIRKMIRDSGLYTEARIIKDLPGKDRVIRCRKR